MTVYITSKRLSTSSLQTITLPANGAAGCPTWDEALVGAGVYPIPTTETAASSSPASWTVGSGHLWTLPNGITSQWLAIIGATVLNNSGSAVNVNTRAYRNGSSAGSTNSSGVNTGNFLTRSHHLRVTPGDTVQLRVWASTALDVRWHGMYIVPTRPWFSYNPKRQLILDFSFTNTLAPTPALGTSPTVSGVGFYTYFGDSTYETSFTTSPPFIPARMTERPIAFTSSPSGTTYQQLGLWSAYSESLGFAGSFSSSFNATNYPIISNLYVPRSITFRSMSV